MSESTIDYTALSSGFEPWTSSFYWDADPAVKLGLKEDEDWQKLEDGIRKGFAVSRRLGGGLRKVRVRLGAKGTRR